MEPGEAEPVQVKGKATKPTGEVPLSRVGDVGEGIDGLVDAGVEGGERSESVGGFQHSSQVTKACRDARPEEVPGRPWLERGEGWERGSGGVDLCKNEGLAEFGRAGRASQD